MKLVKAVCKKCYLLEANHIRAAYYFEQRWKQDLIDCVLPIPSLRYDSPVPQECPYILEHVIEGQTL